MASVKVNSSHNVIGAMKYLLETESHDGEHERIGAISCLNTSPSIAYRQAVDTMKKYGKEKNVQAYLMIQSFSKDELNPDSQEDLDKANQISLETARRMWGDDRQILVVTQSDNGLVHSHVVCLSAELSTGKLIAGEQTGFRLAKRTSDEVIEEYGVANINKDSELKFSDRKTIGEIKKEEKGEYVWKSDLKQRIEDCLNDQNIEDMTSFKQAMIDDYGVEVLINGKNKITYKFVDTENKNRKIRAPRLGSRYDMEGLNYAFTSNRNVEVRESVNKLGEPVTGRCEPIKQLNDPAGRTYSVRDRPLSSIRELDTTIERSNNTAEFVYGFITYCSKHQQAERQRVEETRYENERNREQAIRCEQAPQQPSKRHIVFDFDDFEDSEKDDDGFDFGF